MSIRRQRALILTNCVALATALVLGATLIPVLDAKGAAISAVVGELVLAAITATMLVRARPSLRPPLGRLARVLVAGGAGAAAGLLVPVGDVVGAVVAVVVFAAAAFALRAVPLEVAARAQARKRKRSSAPSALIAVAPRDLLALGEGAPVVGDRDLVEPDARRAQDLRGHLGLEAEVVGRRGAGRG